MLYQNGFDAALLPASRLLEPAFPRKEAISRLRALGCALICFGAAELLPGCFRAGCDDYLKDPWNPDELEWRVQKLCTGREALFSFSWGEFAVGSLQLRSPAGSCALSVQEQSILRLLAVNRGEPVSREALYYGIWGRPAGEESRVVDMHIAALRKKLRRLFPESGDAIHTVRGVGYLIVE
ncbi:MAG: response regulator transcription factor [Spirochaetaceae bacterium]|nr:MAG: response regulator transcription factor [Spirochaetaceae bacterium]